MPGPLILFDKSILQMLNMDEVNELNCCFQPVLTPMIVREINANLKSDIQQRRALSRKLKILNAPVLAAYDSVARAELRGMTIELGGARCYVDRANPSVVPVKGGRAVYDFRPQHKMFSRWANNDIWPEEQAAAQAWHSQPINLAGTAREFRPLLAKWGNLPSLEEMIRAVDAHLTNVDAHDPFFSLSFMLQVLSASDEDKRAAYQRFSSNPQPLMNFAPYAASVMRLYLVFLGCVDKGIESSNRASHAFDLEYLFYAPLCMVFASNDKLHHRLWHAVSYGNDFVGGKELKEALSGRVSARSQSVEQLGGSSDLIAKLHRKYTLRVSSTAETLLLDEVEGDSPL